MYLRQSKDRGTASMGWLNSHHTFSFGHYYDPQHLGFGPIRVINEDKIQGGTGFQPHPHKDMEIISFVIQGALAHQDSMNNSTIIRPFEIQRMSAGTGITHSEMNHEKNLETHFLQIWIHPSHKNMSPSYAQASYADQIHEHNIIHLVGNDSESEKSFLISIHQNINIYLIQNEFIKGTSSQNNKPISTSLFHKKNIWIQTVSGELLLERFTSENNQIKLKEGDGLGLEANENICPTLEFKSANENSTFQALVFSFP